MSKMHQDMSSNELKAHALNMWANYIETSNPNFSASDAAARKIHYNPLSKDSMELVVKLRNLADATMWKEY